MQWALIQFDWCAYKKRRLGHRHTQKEDHMKYSVRMAVYKPMREASGETNPADTLILDF